MLNTTNKTYSPVMRGRLKRVSTCAFFLPLLFGVNTAAETWKLLPKYGVSAGYNDAIQLRENPDSASSVFGYLNAELGRFTEISTFKFHGGGEISKYDSSFPGLNEDFLPFAGISYESQSSERSSWGFSAIYEEDLINQSSRGGAIDEEVSEDTTTGLLNEQLKRETISANAGAAWSVNERAGLSVEYALKQRSYTAAAGLRDSDRHKLDLTLSTAFTDKMAFLTTVGALRFDINNVRGLAPVEQQVDGYSLDIGIRHKLSEISTVTYLIGYDDMEFENEGEMFSDSALTGRVAWNVKGEKSRYQFLAQRSQNPSAAGGFVVTDLIGLTGTWALGELISTRFQGRYYENKSRAGLANPLDERNYLSLSPSLLYKINEKIDLNLSYTYRRQKRDADVSSFDSNEVSIGITYTPLSEI